VKKEFPQTVSTFSTVQVDYESDESLEKAVSELSNRFGRLDVLINNGGASFDMDILQGKRTTRDGFNASWNINVTGTHILTTLAVPLLLKSSKPRLIFIASGTSSLAETEIYSGRNHARINTPLPAGWPKASVGLATTSYRSSKAGLNMLMREWRRILYNDGVKVWAVSPGFLATGLGGLGADKLKEVSA
jgi:NAD(P)-dependent dehydrogenase (short-subunit alcohol dehydrogenase family)